MPASEARIAANRQNALRSSGPKTEGGKLASRKNSLKHGLTGSGVVLADADAAEVERKAEAYRVELEAPGEVGRDLARQMALMSVRMTRAADRERAAIAANVERTMEEFEAPEGVTDEAEIDRLRIQAGRIALFDPSPEAERARKYEGAAIRGFFRALKEIRLARARASAEAKAPAPVPAPQPATPGRHPEDVAFEAKREAARVEMEARRALGSFSPPAPRPAAPARPATPTAPAPRFEAPRGAFDLPITIGRAG